MQLEDTQLRVYRNDYRLKPEITWPSFMEHRKEHTVIDLYHEDLLETQDKIDHIQDLSYVIIAMIITYSFIEIFSDEKMFEASFIKKIKLFFDKLMNSFSKSFYVMLFISFLCEGVNNYLDSLGDFMMRIDYKEHMWYSIFQNYDILAQFNPNLGGMPFIARPLAIYCYTMKFDEGLPYMHLLRLADDGTCLYRYFDPEPIYYQYKSWKYIIDSLYPCMNVLLYLTILILIYNLLSHAFFNAILMIKKRFYEKERVLPVIEMQKTEDDIENSRTLIDQSENLIEIECNDIENGKNIEFNEVEDLNSSIDNVSLDFDKMDQEVLLSESLEQDDDVFKI